MLVLAIRTLGAVLTLFSYTTLAVTGKRVSNEVTTWA